MAGLERKRIAYGSAIAIALGCLLRLVWLDADPDYYIWVGYITDEGRWLENVRALLFHDELLLPESNLHLLVAPLFQAVNYLVGYLIDPDTAERNFLVRRLLAHKRFDVYSGCRPPNDDFIVKCSRRSQPLPNSNT